MLSFQYTFDQWLRGDWQSLTLLNLDDLSDHPERHHICILVAAAFGATGDMKRQQEYACQAIDWGCPKDMAARVLLSGCLNTLGRCAALLDGPVAASVYFKRSTGIFSPTADKSDNSAARCLNELISLGMVPDSLDLILEQSNRINDGLVKDAQTLMLMLRNIQQGVKRGQVRPMPCPPSTRTQPGDDVPSHKIALCAHHKSGTNFLANIFWPLAEELDLPLWKAFYSPEPDNWQVFFHQHGRIEQMVDTVDFRGVHIVRRPKSLLLSATLYHERCKETWVDIPLETFNSEVFWLLSNRSGYELTKAHQSEPANLSEILSESIDTPPTISAWTSPYDFNGRTYREMLQAQKTLADKIRFEMHGFSRGVIHDMLRFPKDARFVDVHLEDVSHDRHMTTLNLMFRHLGFRGTALDAALDRAQKQCLWFKSMPAHATTGVSEQWRELFTGSLEDDYQTLFQGADLGLNYLPE